jgi:recombinase-like zinc beta ribbon protein
MVVCGRCGSRMTVRYHTRQGRLIPDYVCQRDGVEHAIAICQHVVGEHIDKAVGQLLVESVTPLALEVTLAVQQELQARVDEVDQLRKKQVERARYAADLAQRRYLHVDPANRLVADSLEADWNEKLRLLTEAQERYEQQRQHDRAVIGEQQRARIAALASDFPRLWQDPKTPDRERKRMVRLLLEDVTLIRQDQVTVHVRFKGGATQTLTLPRPLTAWELKMTPAQVVAEIDQLMDDRTDKEIVGILNGRGTLSGEGNPFTSRIIARLRRDYQLKPRYDRLREKGFLTIEEISERLNVPPLRVRIWRSHGLLKAYPANDKDAWLYEDPGPDPPRRAPGVRLANRRRFDNNGAHGLQEVQYEA